MNELSRGPWTYEINESCVGEAARLYAGHKMIASVNFADGEGFGNARLMASAPRLLEASKKLSALANTIFVNMTDGEAEAMNNAFTELDAAIANATGINAQAAVC